MVSRRMLFTAGGALVVGATVGFPADAPVPTPGRLDLTTPSYDGFRGLRRVVRSFAFDSVPRRLLVAQFASDGTVPTRNALA